MPVIPLPNLEEKPEPVIHSKLVIDLNITQIARNLINNIHRSEIAWTMDDANTLEYLAMLIREKIHSAGG